MEQNHQDIKVDITKRQWFHKMRNFEEGGADRKLLFIAIKLHFNNSRNFFFSAGTITISPHPHPTRRKPESRILNQVVEGTH